MANATKTKPRAKKATKAAGKTRGKRVGPSRRAKQRLIALNMGLAGKGGAIPLADLHEACRKAGLLEGNGSANFTQDMKKDKALFAEVTKAGKRTGWKLTEAGRKIAKQAAASGGKPTLKISTAKPEKPQKVAAN